MYIVIHPSIPSSPFPPRPSPTTTNNLICRNSDGTSRSISYVLSVFLLSFPPSCKRFLKQPCE